MSRIEQRRCDECCGMIPVGFAHDTKDDFVYRRWTVYVTLTHDDIKRSDICRPCLHKIMTAYIADLEKRGDLLPDEDEEDYAD